MSGITVPGLGIVLLGLLVGILSGLLGVGGGFLVTPMLNVLFGIPYHIAVGSELTQMVGTSLFGVLGHTRKGKVDFKLGALLSIGSFFGVLGGTRLINQWRDMGTIVIGRNEVSAVNFFLSILYLVLLTVIGIFTFREAFGPEKNETRDNDINSSRMENFGLRMPPLARLEASGVIISIWLLLIAGFGIGLLSGLMGVGGGFIALPLMIYVFNVPTDVAIGTSLFQVLFAAIFASSAHILTSNVNWPLVGLILTGSVVGVQIGVRLSHKTRSVTLRRYFVILIFAAALLILFKTISTMGG